MGINPSVVASSPLLLAMVVIGILLVRGVPVFIAERFTNTGSGLQSMSEKVELALYSAAGLPIIVAVTSIATSSGLLESSTASLLVTGGALTVLLFPLWAAAIKRAFRSQTAEAESGVSKRAQIDALKAHRNATVKLTTGMIPAVKPTKETHSPLRGKGSSGSSKTQKPPEN